MSDDVIGRPFMVLKITKKNHLWSWKLQQFFRFFKGNTIKLIKLRCIQPTISRVIFGKNHAAARWSVSEYDIYRQCAIVDASMQLKPQNIDLVQG